MQHPQRSRSTQYGRLGIVLAGLLIAGSVSVAAATEGEDPSESSTSSTVDVDRFSLVEIDTASVEARQQVIDLGLDIAEAGMESTTVLLHGTVDEVALEDAGLAFDVVVADLEERNAQARAEESERASRLPGAAESELAAPENRGAAMPDQPLASLLPPRALATDDDMAKAASDLPSGRVSYRTMFEINNELRYLARTYPNRVELFQLPHPTLLGATVWGIELTHDVAVRSGKPAMLMSGVHHSREWPTAEYTMELAWDLLLNDGVDDRVTNLLDTTRVVFVPVVNPDGYVMSRSLTQEFKRKNCRVEPGEIPGPNDCADPDNFAEGVDLNRNYGSYWGSIGASANQTRSNYRGTEPFSEPEIQNMRELAAHHQFTIAINNHTPDQRILRAPADLNEPDPVDEDQYQTLAEALAEPPGYQAGPWDEIYYNGSGVAEQYAFYSTGAFAFTPELDLGEGGFHPPYEGLISEWDQHRETYLRAMEATADPAAHAVITGTAPAGAELTIENAFTMYTAPVLQSDGSQGPIQSFEAAFASTIVVPSSGEFTWHVNASVRPAEFVSAVIADDWTVSCAKRPGKKVRQQIDVTVARGESVAIDFDTCGRRRR